MFYIVYNKMLKIMTIFVWDRYHFFRNICICKTYDKYILCTLLMDIWKFCSILKYFCLLKGGWEFIKNTNKFIIIYEDMTKNIKNDSVEMFINRKLKNI